jgi:putative exporter of polyketide antibiotics
MHILFLVLFVSIAVLLWAAFSIARHIRRHRAERRITQDAVLREPLETTEPAQKLGMND